MHAPCAETIQIDRLNRLLQQVWERNPFYSQKWRRSGVRCGDLSSLGDFASYPLLTRDELLADQRVAPPHGTNVTGSCRDLKRFHRSSGTTRAPVLWADSAESWDWVTRCSHRLWCLAGVQSRDRVLFLMTFGVSSGPWIMYEGACRLGCGCIRTGLDNQDEQLHGLANLRPTVVAGKPGVLHALGLKAKSIGLAPSDVGVRKLILTGEHAAGIRGSLEELWGAECFDRYGLTEAGSVASECPAHSGGLHLLDDEFVAEVIDPDTGWGVSDGEMGELVLTNLGRSPCPIIRYRTGDWVRRVRDRACDCGLTSTLLLGGVRRGPPCSDVVQAGR